MRKRFGSNEEVIKAYLSGNYEGGRSGNGNLFFEGDTLYSYGYHFPLAVDCGRYYVVNGDKYSSTTSTRHQSPLFRMIPDRMRLEIPFSALAAMANLTKWYSKTPSIAREIDVIDWEGDRYIDTGRVSKIDGHRLYDHVLGGSVFRWQGKYYVSSMDLSGVGKRGRFFLTEIAQSQVERYGEPTSVDEAIELLKPAEVKKAEEAGCEVHRQGEWFFVRDSLLEPKKGITKQYELVHKDDKDPAHIASEGFSVKIMGEFCQVVRGIVKHNRKEHKQLKLYEVGEKDRP